MNQRLLELALKKQRLQMQAATQRLQMAQHLQAFAPVLGVLQGAQHAGAWMRSHSHWLMGAGVVLLIVRPRTTFRWLRRGLIAWQFLRRTRGALQAVVSL